MMKKDKKQDSSKKNGKSNIKLKLKKSKKVAQSGEKKPKIRQRTMTVNQLIKRNFYAEKDRQKYEKIR